MSVRTALDFASLVGKYVSMTRPSTAAELTTGDPLTIGGEGLVVRVEDAGPGLAPGVFIEWDDSMGFFVLTEEDQGWRFEVWLNETASTRPPRTCTAGSPTRQARDK